MGITLGGEELGPDSGSGVAFPKLGSDPDATDDEGVEKVTVGMGTSLDISTVGSKTGSLAVPVEVKTPWKTRIQVCRKT
jgi:hypothetical protein